MRLFLLAVTLVACASAVEVISPRGYHEDIGIPLAAKIKQEEEKIMANKLAFKDERIIGGVLAPANEHPYYAGLLIDLLNRPGQSVCGSSLVQSKRLLTAAHCWSDGRLQAWRFTVILGTQSLHWGGTRVQTTSVIMHPQWTPANLRNDIAVIFLAEDVEFSASIQTVSLPNIYEQSQTFVNQWANAVGFGKTSDSQAGASSVLSHVNLQVITEQQCRISYGSSFVFYSTLCTSGAGRVGVCGGDSGGPLVIRSPERDVLIGVAAFAATNQCEGSHPSGFMRVTSFMDFINQYLE